MSQESFATRLYRGEVSWNFIGRRRLWYAFSGLIMLIGIVSLIVRGLNPSIDFKGGAIFEGPLNGHTISQVDSAVSAAGVTPQESQTTGGGSSTHFQIQTQTLTEAQVTAITNNLTSDIGITQKQLSTSTVGSTWGSQITNKAIEGLIIFLVTVMLYLSIRFEYKMAIAAMAALIHDLVITAGIYSLIGLEVSPSTVIAILTVLGYSLYDTVVVFDKVRENTEGILGGSRMTFTQASNLAVNQTLVRSINTSIIALLPVIGLLVIGVGFLGAGSLEDLSFALLIGLASGAYSSIFIATPLLTDLKEREPAYQQLSTRVVARRGKEARADESLGTASPADVAVLNHDVEQLAVDGDDHSLSAPSFAAASSTPRVGARPPASQRRKANRGTRPGGRGTKSHKRR